MTDTGGRQGRIGRERSRLMTVIRRHLATANLLTIDDFTAWSYGGRPWLAANLRGQRASDHLKSCRQGCARRAGHIEHVRVDHRRADTRMPEQNVPDRYGPTWSQRERS
jgi:hypothetical protein